MIKNITLQFIIVFGLIGCGGNSSTSEKKIKESSEDTQIISNAGISKIDSFLDKHYGNFSKGTYETTEEWMKKREKDFLEIKGKVITFLLPEYVLNSYDADTKTLKIEGSLDRLINFESNIGSSLSYTGANSRIYYHSLSVGDMSYTRMDTYIFDNVNSIGNLVNGGRGTLSFHNKFPFHYIITLPMEVSEAQRYSKRDSIGKKILIRTNYSSIYHSKNYSVLSKESVTYTHYSGSLVSIIFYDKKSGEELAKLITQ